MGKSKDLATLKDNPLSISGPNGDILNVSSTTGSEFAMRVDGNEVSFKADADNDDNDTVMTFDLDNSEKMRIDTTGKVGIGDTTPSDGLTVKGDTGHDTIAIKYSGTSGGHKSGYIFKDFRGQTNAGIYNYLENDAVGTEAANMEFHTANGGTLTKQMNISKHGHINMPNQPAFYAYTTNDPNPASASEYITSGAGWNWAEAYDQTNSFSNGTFTAPIGGRYYFSVMWNRLSVQSRIAIRKNNSNYMRWEPSGRTDDAWESQQYSVMIYLAANDWVSLYGEYSGTSSHPFHMGTGAWGHFGGYMIAQEINMTSILKVNEIQHSNGTNGITINSSGFIAPKVPLFKVNLDSNSVDYSSNNWILIDFSATGSVEFDNTNAWDTANEKWTPQTAGHYQVNCQVTSGSGNIRSVGAAIYKNGSEVHKSNLWFGAEADGDDALVGIYDSYYHGEIKAKELAMMLKAYHSTK